MALKYTKKKKAQEITLKDELLNMLSNLHGQEMAVLKKIDPKTANTYRSTLSRAAKEIKIGFGSNYNPKTMELKVWREKYVDPKEKKAVSRTKITSKPKVVDERLENLKVGKSFVVREKSTVDAEIYRLRRQAKALGMEIKTEQVDKVNVRITRVS